MAILPCRAQSVKLFIEERYYPSMSLNDFDKNDDPYEDLAPKRKRGKGAGGKILGKTKLFVIILIFGILIGAFMGHYYLEPLLAEAEGSSCKSCLASKELLTKEHDCLYSIIGDVTQINSCKDKNIGS